MGAFEDLLSGNGHEDRDDCTLSSDVSEDVIQAIEDQHAAILPMLDHLIDVVGMHHSGKICPIYCYGEHFVADLVHMNNIGGSPIPHLLYLACARLAGIDVE